MSENAGVDHGGRRGGKSPEAFRTISEVSKELDIPQHVLRFWETKFSHIKPLKRAGGRRYYRPDDIELLRRIQSLLYTDGYTIKGVQKMLRENGVKSLLSDASIVLDNTSETPAEGTKASPEGNGTGSLSVVQKGEISAVLEDLQKVRNLLSKSQGN